MNLELARKRFLISVAIILVVTASAKLWTVLGPWKTQILHAEEPMLGVSFGVLLLIAAVTEIMVAAVCIFGSRFDGLFSVFWLASVLCVYRLGLSIVEWTRPCGCLGNLTDALHISPQLADNIMKGLLAFMFIGSVSLLILHRRGRAAGLNAVKMPAPEI